MISSSSIFSLSIAICKTLANLFFSCYNFIFNYRVSPLSSLISRSFWSSLWITNLFRPSSSLIFIYFSIMTFFKPSICCWVCEVTDESLICFWLFSSIRCSIIDFSLFVSVFSWLFYLSSKDILLCAKCSLNSTDEFFVSSSSL